MTKSSGTLRSAKRETACCAREQTVRHSRSWRASGAAWSALVSLAVGGCSLIVDSEKQQCETDKQCSDKFGAESGLTCTQGLCEPAGCKRDADCVALGVGYESALCVDGACEQPSAVSEPAEWACLDTAREPMSLPGPFVVTMQLTHMVTMSKLKGVNARLCRALDVTCDAPEETTVSDNSGQVTLNVTATFRGYVALDTPGLMPTLYFFNPAIDHDQDLGAIQMGPAAVGVGLSEQAMASPKQQPDRGIVLMSAYDCQSGFAPGISFASSNVDVQTNIFYAIGTFPNVSATETDPDGYGGFINALPGAMTIEGKRAADGRSVGQISVLVKPGALTVTRMVP